VLTADRHTFTLLELISDTMSCRSLHHANHACLSFALTQPPPDRLEAVAAEYISRQDWTSALSIGHDLQSVSLAWLQILHAL